MADALYTAADNMATHAPTASASLATISAGSDVLVSNFAGLQSLVDDLTSLASAFKDNRFYPPVGSVLSFAGSTAPGGWYLCDGKSWATLGLTTGDDLYDLLQPLGWTGVPDLRGRVIAGVDSTGFTNIDTYPTRLRPVSANAATLGQVIGDARPQQHNHTQDAHYHTVQVRNDVGWAGIGNNGIAGSAAVNNWSGVNQTDLSQPVIQNKFSGTQQNVQPTMMLNYIIKA